MYKKNISKIVDEILDWAGPSGLCWCEEEQRFLDPQESEGCSDCEPINVIDEPPTHYLGPNETFLVRTR